MKEYLVNFQKYAMWGINSSYVLKNKKQQKKKQVRDQKDFPTNYIYSLLIAVPAQHSLNSKRNLKLSQKNSCQHMYINTP